MNDSGMTEEGMTDTYKVKSVVSNGREEEKARKRPLIFLCSNDPASNQTSKFKTNKETCQKKKVC